jgi:dTDP-4-dehydrorhamnose reductase
MKKTILLIGSNGMAGHVISEFLSGFKDYTILRVARENLNQKTDYFLDVTDFNKTERLINNVLPNVIINAVGILNKEAELNPDKAILLNTYFPHFLAKICNNISASLIHISTDCVFSGKKGNYIENDIKDGIGFYAQSKALGEVTYNNHLTIRTSIIGPDLKESGIGLFNWVLNQKGSITGYANAFWGGVTTLELAKAIDYIIRENAFNLNLVHLTNGNKICKLNLIELINDRFNLNLNIVSSSEYKVDKSLINTNSKFNYLVPSYKTMINDIYEWVSNYKQIYNI